MSKTIAIGIVAVLCLALVGCGGSDGPNLRPELKELTEQVGELKTEVETERQEAADREQALKEQVEEAEQEVEDITDTAQQLADAQQRAADAEARLQQQQQAAQQRREAAALLEANQKAERLLTVLQGIVIDGTPLANPGMSSSKVAISVPSRNSLTFKSAGYAPRTISAPGLRGARLTQSRGGTQTAVVYTDIELSRSLIKTYDAAADANTMTFDLPVGDGANQIGALTDLDFLADEDAVTITERAKIPSLLSDDTDGGNIVGEEIPSFRGSLHGIPGTYQCDTGNCITLTAIYDSDRRLTEVTLAGSGVDFKPDSRTVSVSLCDSPRSQCAATDADYMAFGWWRSESAGGSYQFEPFAFGPGLTASNATPSAAENASFDGTAVGMYVEQNQAGTAVTKKQGEFVAAARLDHDGTSLTGTIDGFRTTPTGDSGAPSTTGWVVKLNTGGLTEFERLGPDGSGTWTHAYTTDGSAVVGTFESELEEILHIVGAFGAKQ